MIRLLMGLVAVAALPQSQAEKKAEHPPYRVTVTAKTKFARWKDAYKEFQDRLKKIMPGATYLGTDEVPNDKAGWERWNFQIAWDCKFDQAKFNKLYGEMKIGKIELSVRGEAAVDMKAKTVSLTAFGEKIKLKLLNRPKQDFNDVPENQLAKLVEVIKEGKNYFEVRGEIVSSGEVWSILLDGFSAIPEPRK